MADVSNFELEGVVYPVKDSTARKDISDLNTFRSLNGQKCVVLGDSYNKGVGGQEGRGFGYYFQEWTGADCLIKQNAGGGFIATGSSGSDYPNENYVSIVPKILGLIPEDEKPLYKWFIIGGGYNDGKSEYFNESQLATNMSTVIDAIKADLPNCSIAIIPMHNADNFDDDTRVTCYNAYCSIGARYGCLVTPASIFWFSGYDSMDAGDGVHLNNAGYQRAGRLVASALIGFQGNYQRMLNGSTSGDVDFVNGAGQQSGQRFRMYEQNGIMHILGAIRVPDIQPSTTYVNLPSTIAPWGALPVAAVFQTSNSYTILPIIIDHQSIRTTADLKGASGEGSIRLCCSYPIKF